MKKIKFLLLAILLSACSCEISGQTTLDFLVSGISVRQGGKYKRESPASNRLFGDSWEREPLTNSVLPARIKDRSQVMLRLLTTIAPALITEFANSDLPNATYGSWWPTWADLYYKVTSRKAVITNMGRVDQSSTQMETITTGIHPGRCMRQR